MSKYLIYGAFALSAVALVLLFMRASKLVNLVVDSPSLPRTVTTLKPSEQEKFLVTPNHLTTVSRTKVGKVQVKTEYVPTRALITLDKDGQVVVKVQKYGLCFQPELGLGYSEALRIAPNAKLMYYDRLGLNMGLSLRLSSQLSPRIFVALSYAVVSNTAVFVGVDHTKNVIGGVAVRF